MSSTSMQWYRKMTARPILQKRRNILKLISLYRAKRVLWDRSNSRYTDQPTRKAAWRDISSRFPCSVEELKLKMTSLLKAYDREMKKEMCPLCARKDPREVYRSKWFAYNSFDFLRTVPPRIRGPNKVGPSIWDSDNNSDTDNEHYGNAVFIKEEPGAFETEEDYEFDGDDSGTATDEATTQGSSNDHDSLNFGTHFLAQAQLSSPPKIPVKRITVIKRKRPSMDEAEQTCKNATSAPVPDECSTFVDHLKTKLEKFDNPDRAIIMHTINSAIFEAEMKKYGHADSPQSQPENSINVPVSINPRPVPIEHSWLTPVLRVPKLEL